MLNHDACFLGSHAQVTWQGKIVSEVDSFNGYLQGPVRNRLLDEENRTAIEADLRALATTDMATETLSNLLASEPNHEPWEVGEALAECLLADEYGITWPWNMERDKRTPKASLPGADLVGFIEIDGQVFLALGEVKTSSDASAPPGTMHGRSGMIHQLDNLATSPQIHWCLLQWLIPRCKNTDSWPLCQAAIESYLSSGGRALVLFGLLMRDTQPNELDLINRAQALANSLAEPTSARLTAWYLPCDIDKWPALMAGEVA